MEGKRPDSGRQRGCIMLMQLGRKRSGQFAQLSRGQLRRAPRAAFGAIVLVPTPALDLDLGRSIMGLALGSDGVGVAVVGAGQSRLVLAPARETNRRPQALTS